MAKIGEKALIPNPALKPFGVLVGKWKTVGSHPYFPDVVLHGRASFDWIEGGAFLILHSEIDHPEFPDGIEIFGSDDAEKKFFMLHFDERGVSRKYDVTIDGNQITWFRNDPKFSQRMTLTIDEAGRKMTSKGKMLRDGGKWEGDLELAFTRDK